MKIFNVNNAQFELSIFVYAFSNNELFMKELKGATKINETTLRNNIKDLVKFGFIEERREGQKIVYSLIVNQLEKL